MCFRALTILVLTSAPVSIDAGEGIPLASQYERLNREFISFRVARTKSPSRTFTSVFTDQDGKQKITPCGVRGGIKQRIADCAVTKKVGAHLWQLITRSKKGKEVWLEKTQGRAWSDEVVPGMGQNDAKNFCKNPKKGEDIKGGLDLKFELPDIKHYQDAEKHGIRRVLPYKKLRPVSKKLDLEVETRKHAAWSSTQKGIYGQAYSFYNGKTLTFEYIAAEYRVRCIAFLKP